MSKTKDKDLNKRKPRKGVYLSDIAIKEITEVLSHYNTALNHAGVELD